MTHQINILNPNLRHTKKEVSGVTRCKYTVNKHQNLHTRSARYEVQESCGFVYFNIYFVIYAS